MEKAYFPADANASFIASQAPAGMVGLLAGQFNMGSDECRNAQPVHSVTLNAFNIDITPVTQDDYQSLMNINPSRFKGKGRRPVEKLSWFDAVLYCNARSKRDGLDPVYRYSETIYHPFPGDVCGGLVGLEIDFSQNGFRLPTEAEWEYACRAGSATNYYWGNEMDDNYAWEEKNSNGTTHPVGARWPNTWGLYDMSGNVWEWCNDWYGKAYYEQSPSNNPKGPKSGTERVLRGGSCYSHHEALYSSRRTSLRPDLRINYFGFRCVCSRQ